MEKTVKFGIRQPGGEKMWQIAKLENGNWEELDKFDSLEQARSVELSAKGDNIFYFWAGPFPSGESESVALFDKVNQANNGRINRITIGLNLNSATKDTSVSSCPGKCFCVVAHGARRCEVEYCRPDGVCWWVDCGVGC